MIPKLQYEMWLARQVLGREWDGLFAGVTTVAGRCFVLSCLIREKGLSDKPLGRNDTYRTAFERLYRCPLEQQWAA